MGDTLRVVRESNATPKRVVVDAMSAVLRLSFGVVDVRDVADLHLRAMTRRRLPRRRS